MNPTERDIFDIKIDTLDRIAAQLAPEPQPDDPIDNDEIPRPHHRRPQRHDGDAP